MSQHTLYRFWRDEELLYVGISFNAYQRASAHRQNSEFFPLVSHVTFEYFEDRQSCLAAERAAILSEAPTYNVKGNATTYRERHLKLVKDEEQKARAGYWYLTEDQRRAMSEETVYIHEHSGNIPGALAALSTKYDTIGLSQMPEEAAHG